MEVITKKPYVSANCRICGQKIFGRQYEMVKPRGHSALYFCPSCVKKQIGGQKDERE